jgi:hypothetical protein
MGKGSREGSMGISGDDDPIGGLQTIYIDVQFIYATNLINLI